MRAPFIVIDHNGQQHQTEVMKGEAEKQRTSSRLSACTRPHRAAPEAGAWLRVAFAALAAGSHPCSAVLMCFLQLVL